MRKYDTKRKEVPERELNYPCVYVVDMGYRRPFRRAVAVYVIAYADVINFHFYLLIIIIKRLCERASIKYPSTYTSKSGKIAYFNAI